MAEHDFMPLDGWDHLEIWVGNAKQSAYFYEHAYGFTRTAYAGPETGVRDRASYVARAGRHPARPHERPPCRQRDLQVGGDEGRQRARRRARRPRRRRTRTGRRSSAALAVSSSRTGSRTTMAASSSRRSRPTATTSTRSSTAPSTRARTCPGFQSVSPNGGPAGGVGLVAIDHVVGNVELGRMDEWVEFYARVLGLHPAHALLGRGHLDRVLGAHVQGDDGR